MNKYGAENMVLQLYHGYETNSTWKFVLSLVFI